jgi:hypothetical protein
VIVGDLPDDLVPPHEEVMSEFSLPPVAAVAPFAGSPPPPIVGASDMSSQLTRAVSNSAPRRPTGESPLYLLLLFC